MKITRVDALLMSCPLPEPLRLPFHGGERTILKRDAMLIRIATDAGLCGYAPGPAHERAATHIREHIGPFLVGRDPRKWREIRFTASPEIQKTYHASEIALLDLTARFEGCPLSEIAGARQRSRIKLYGSAGMYMAPDAYAEEAAAIQAQGFLAYKMRPALGPDGDLEALAHMRAATGPTFGLMIDAHSWWRMGDRSYTRDMVATLAREMEAHRPVWLEEPLPPDDHDAYRWLKQQTRLPVATGEHEQATQGLLDVIETGAADIIQMDVCCQGGLPTFQAVSRTAEAHGRRVAFHSWGTMLEVLVAAHLGVCWPEQVVEWLEHPCYASPGRAGMYPFGAADEILSEPLAIEDGYLSVPDRPGLGIDVDETVVDRYPFIPGPWSIFRIDSPRSTVAVVGDHSVKWVEAEQTIATPESRILIPES